MEILDLLRKRIEPKQGHALFFPFREKERVVVGKPTMMRRWPQEEFKQIQLGNFSVTTILGPNSPKPPAKTSDNLPCKAQVEFRLKINEDEKSIEKATRTCSVSTDIRVVIAHEFFKKELQGELETIVEKCVRQVAYLDLLKTPELAGKVEESILSDAGDQATNWGFALIGCRADVEIVELNPQALAQNEKLINIWIDAKRREEELTNEIKEVKRQSQLTEDRKESAYLVDKDDVVKSKDVQIREHNIKEEQDKLEKKEKSTQIQRAIQTLDTSVQREKSEYEQDVKRRNLEDEQEIEQLKISSKLSLEKEEKQSRFDQEREELARQANLAEMRRQEEVKERETEFQRLQHELKLDKLRLEREELRLAIADTESKGITAVGKAQAEVDRDKGLAAHAHTMKMNEALLDSLPAILEKAYAPAEKLGEVKILYLGGRNANASGEHQPLMEQTLGAILSSMSALPMVKEALRFLKDWELPLVKGSDEDGVSINKQYKQQSAGHAKEVDYESEADNKLRPKSKQPEAQNDPKGV